MTSTQSPLPPQTTPLPPAVPLAQSAATTPPLPTPKLKLNISDLTSAATRLVLSAIPPPTDLLLSATTTVITHLYPPPLSPPPIRTITLHLRDFPGVAYTTGTAARKHIHLSTRYLAGRSLPADALAREIRGVVVHEMVHVWQHNGGGTAPGGLIEGIADWVRLRAGLAAAHWQRGGGAWDQGYQNTAYFLEWLERARPGLVCKVNEELGRGGYDGCWERALGVRGWVQEMWGGYCAEFGLVDETGEGRAVEKGGVEEEEAGSEDGRDVDTSDEEGEGRKTPEKAERTPERKPQVVLSPEHRTAPTPNRVLFKTTPSRTVISRSSPLDGVFDDDPADETDSDYSPPSDGDSLFGPQLDATAREILADRLKQLTCADIAGGDRFVDDFRELVTALDINLEDRMMKLMLRTALRGELREWADAQDADWSFETLCTELKRRFSATNQGMVQNMLSAQGRY